MMLLELNVVEIDLRIMLNSNHRPSMTHHEMLWLMMTEFDFTLELWRRSDTDLGCNPTSIDWHLIVNGEPIILMLLSKVMHISWVLHEHLVLLNLLMAWTVLTVDVLLSVCNLIWMSTNTWSS